MGGDDDRIREDWDLRNRQLDWQYTQTQTERELELIRLRGGDSSHADASDEPGTAYGVAGTDARQLAQEIVADHREIVGRLEDAGIEPRIADRWTSTLLEIEPLRPGADRQVMELADAIRGFLNTTTDWELARGSTGMVIRDSLELTRFMLIGLAEKMAAYRPG